MYVSNGVRLLSCCALTVSLAAAASADRGDPWADHVVGYDPGSTPAAGYTDPQTAVGPPERFTGEGSYPVVVSVFSPPFGTDEIVSIGEGGHLILGFDEPITNDPSHRFGIDFLVFGAAGFVDNHYPYGQVGSPPGMFGDDEMCLSVSSDGVTFVDLTGTFIEGFFPTQGYLDAGPYDPTPGTIPTDYTLPVDPTLTLNDFAGLTLAEILGLYDGSGGGTPIDIAGSGLSSVSFVRIDVFDDANPNTELNAEIDALATVPEPSSFVLFGILVLAGMVGKKQA